MTVAESVPSGDSRRVFDGVKTGRCFRHDGPGGCPYGAGCKYHHVGEAENGFKDPSRPAHKPAPKPKKQSETARLASLVDKLVALIAGQETATPPDKKWCVNNLIIGMLF
jgi:hypothetical protein